jgi:predicted transcriptional regulator
MKLLLKPLQHVIRYLNDKEWAKQQEQKVSEFTDGMATFIDVTIYELEKVAKNTMRVYSIKQVKATHMETLHIAAKSPEDAVNLVKNREKILVETIRETEMFSYRENTENIKAYEII